MIIFIALRRVQWTISDDEGSLLGGARGGKHLLYINPCQTGTISQMIYLKFGTDDQ